MESQGRFVPHRDLHAAFFPPPSSRDHVVTCARRQLHPRAALSGRLGARRARKTPRCDALSLPVPLLAPVRHRRGQGHQGIHGDDAQPRYPFPHTDLRPAPLLSTPPLAEALSKLQFGSCQAPMASVTVPPLLSLPLPATAHLHPILLPLLGGLGGDFWEPEH